MVTTIIEILTYLGSRACSALLCSFVLEYRIWSGIFSSYSARLSIPPFFLYLQRRRCCERVLRCRTLIHPAYRSCQRPSYCCSSRLAYHPPGLHCAGSQETVYLRPRRRHHLRSERSKVSYCMPLCISSPTEASLSMPMILSSLSSNSDPLRAPGQVRASSS